MNFNVWKYYARLYRTSLWPLLFAVFASGLGVLLNILILFCIRALFDTIIPRDNLYQLIAIALTIMGLYIANDGLMLGIRYGVLQTTKGVIQQLRDHILKRLYDFSRTHDAAKDHGAVHTMVVQDTERIDILSNALIAQFIPAILTGATIFLILLYLNWLLTLLLASVIPVIFFVDRPLRASVKDKIKIFHRSFENFSKGILFVLQKMDLTKILAAEDYEIERQEKNIREVRSTSQKMAWITAAYNLLQNSIASCATVLALAVGGAHIARGRMTIGELLAFYAAIAILRNQLSTVFFCLPQLIEGNESLQKVYAWLRADDTPPYRGTRKIDFTGSFRLENVCFSYNDTPLLRNISFEVHPGRTVAIIGANGTGKSTIVSLLLGFYRPQQGQVYADGNPLAELDLTHLRRSIGVVCQEPIFFSGTIQENILYGCPQARLTDMVTASRWALAHDFIQQLPRAYDTFIGENGMMLSGGQRQCIAIARALLRQPRLLILDEPSNHLDKQTIEGLAQNLQNLIQTPAIMIISHDAVIMNAVQSVYTLNNGTLWKA